MDQAIFWNIILATALGALIGTERAMPWSKKKLGITPVEGTGFGGIRTYALLAFFGALSAWLDTMLDSNIWKIFGMILASVFIVISYIYSSFRQGKIGMTSEFAALLTYIIGVIVMSGYKIIAVILAILLLILLSSKEYLTAWKEKFSREELSNSLKFAVISLVALPLLPDEKYSIMDMLAWIAGGNIDLAHPVLWMKFFNPFGVWLFVVIMAGVEYIGYILSKVLGNNSSIIASGAVGGMISSTATTAAMTNKSVHHTGNHFLYATGTLVASCIMFIRVVIISAFYSPAILGTIILPAIIMFITLAGSAYFFLQKTRQEPSKTILEKLHITKSAGEKPDEYESPFQILPALKFAGVVVVIKFIAGIGLIYQALINPQIFYYILGLISGLADVDAITQDMASKSAEGALPMLLASSTILIAVMSNNIVKASIAYRFGEKKYGIAVVTGFGVSIISGLLTIGVMNVLR